MSLVVIRVLFEAQKMGNLDGAFAESGITSTGFCPNAAEIDQECKYDQEELRLRKYSAPAYKEIRTRKNGIKANGLTMNGNGIKVKTSRSNLPRNSEYLLLKFNS